MKAGYIPPTFTKHIRIQELYTDIIYIKDGNNEYGIPLSYEAEKYGVQNYKLYKMPELMDKLREAVSIEYTGQGGIGKNNGNAYLVYYIILVLALMSVISCILMHKKNTFSNK